MQLRAITNGYVIYTHGTKIVAESITQDACDILKWYYKHIPANQY